MNEEKRSPGSLGLVRGWIPCGGSCLFCRISPFTPLHCCPEVSSRHGAICTENTKRWSEDETSANSSTLQVHGGWLHRTGTHGAEDSFPGAKPKLVPPPCPGASCLRQHRCPSPVPSPPLAGRQQGTAHAVLGSKQTSPNPHVLPFWAEKRRRSKASLTAGASRAAGVSRRGGAVRAGWRPGRRAGSRSVGLVPSVWLARKAPPRHE